MYTGALLMVGASVGIIAAVWLFSGDAVDGDGARAGARAREEAVVAGEKVVEAPPLAERIVVRTRRAERPQERKPDQGDDAAEPEIRAGEYIEALRAAGETGGIAAFNPPGTDPTKSGILVPDDYELPEGYARRYQTTDDGKQLPAILMFSPDFEFLDANGNPIPLPDDLIVPPEMAPPGLPLRMLKLGKRADR